MKKKIIVSLSIIFVLITAVVIGVKLDREYRLSQIEYREIKLNNENCEISIDEENSTVVVLEYKGNEDCVIIPEEINGYAVENIDVESFSECYNLETIKLPKKVAENIGEIPDFEISKNQEEGDYVVYETTREYSDIYESYLYLSEEEKSEVKIIPNKFDVPISKIYSSDMQELYGTSITTTETLEASYDLRNYINIEVENQKEFGTCYAYASLSSVETNLALTRNEYVDFSEIHASVLTTGYGGYLFTSADEYYLNKIGPAYETDFSMSKIYDEKFLDDEITAADLSTKEGLINAYLRGETVTGVTLSESQLAEIQNYMKEKTAAEYVTETVRFPSITKAIKTDSSYADSVTEVRNAIKTHIKTYGSIATCVSMDAVYQYNNYVTVNNQSSSVYNHGVSIVGWNDNFSISNFPTNNRPSAKGAYLVLNSYGEDWGANNGYFWVSYEDQFIETNLVGVVSVEDPASNMDLATFEITDTTTNSSVNNAEIKKGQEIKVSTVVNVGAAVASENTQSEITSTEITSTNEIAVSLRDDETTYNDNITVTGNEIVDNQATIEVVMTTSDLKNGDYVLDFVYGDETISKVFAVTGDFIYEVNDDDTITITGYAGSATAVEIPSEYDGYTVSGIGDGAFASNTSITSVTISTGITSIGTEAFYACTALKTVTIPEGVTAIADRAFYKCSALTNINIPNGVTSIGIYSFSDCSSLTSIVLPDGILSLGERAFNNCTKLTSINLPSTINRIDLYAFAATALSSVTIPSSVKTISEGLFLNCTKLTKVIIPNGVTTVEMGVFQGCTYLEFVKFPRSVTAIAGALFSSCTRLKRVVVFSDTTDFTGETWFKKAYYAVMYVETGSTAETYATTEGNSYVALENYTVTYNANAGYSNVENMPLADTKVQADDYTISKDVPYRYGYIFDGWATSEDATTAEYQPSEVITGANSITEMDSEGDITLYAVWSDDPSVDKVDIGDFTLEDAEYVYDGTAKTIISEGYDPETVDVAYIVEPIGTATLKNGEAVEVGQYKVTAKYALKGEQVFIDGVSSKTAILTITKATHDMTEITFEDAEYTFDRTEKNILIGGTLPSGVSVEYENNAKRNAGTYTVTANFVLADSKNYNSIESKTATLTINKATIDMSKISFTDKTVGYNGREQVLEVEGEIPVDVVITYDNNTGTEIGEYTATAEFSISESEVNNYNELSITKIVATLTIKTGTFDLSTFKFEDTTYTYDGTEKTLTIVGTLPEGVTVSYENNKLKNRGSVTAIATFTIDESLSDKYAPIDPMTAVLTIELGKIDMSGITFEDAEFVYDEQPHTIFINGELPDLVTVSYENNTRTEIGTNVATANFVVDESERDNYATIDSMTANITILKKPSTIEITNKEELNKVYDGNVVVDPVCTRSREGDILVEYYAGTEATGTVIAAPKDAGTYTVKVILQESDYYAEATDTATFVISKAETTIEITNEGELNKTYDETAVEVKYESSRTGAITVEYKNADTKQVLDSAPINAGNYSVKVTIAESANYNGASDEIVFVIAKATKDMSKVQFNDVEYPYDGTEKEIVITGELPEGVEVSYENNKGLNVGIYEAIAKFTVVPESEAANYNAIPNMNAILEIIATSGTIEITNSDELSKVYDGLPVTEPTYEQSRDGNVRIEYYLGTDVTGEKLESAPIDSGIYTVKVVLEAYEGYLEVSDTATFEISKVERTISITNEEALNRVYDGTAVDVLYEEPAVGDVNVTIEYTNLLTQETTNTAPVNAGTYDVKVILAEETNYTGAVAEAIFEITKVERTVTITNEEELNRTYDGNSVEVKYDVTEVGERNITVSYLNTETSEKSEEAPINAGTYTVEVKLEEEENYAGATAKLTFRIEKIESSITITNGDVLSKVYDKSSVVAPEYEASREGTVIVEYVVTATGTVSTIAPIEAGNYIARVTLEEELNYASASDEVEFEISKATIDMSSVKFEDTTFDYNEQPHTLEITGELPEGVEVSYENNTHTDVGEYTAIAKFSITLDDAKNYNAIPNKTAKVIIQAVTGSIEITNADQLTKQYDGLPAIEPTYEQSRDGNVRIEYYSGTTATGEKLESAPIDSGTYTVKVVLEAYQGYLETSDQATFKITKIPSSIEITNEEELNKQYDGQEVEVQYETSREGTVTVEYYEGTETSGEKLESAPINAGTYTVKVILKEETNYAGSTDKATFTITKVPSTIKITNLNELNRVYSENAIEAKYEASREGTVTIEYKNATTGETLDETPKMVGKYSVTVTLAEELNYEGATATASYEITKIPTTITITNENKLNKIYDGNVTEVEYEPSRPGDVTVEYTNVETSEVISAPVDSGKYKVKVSIAETEIYQGASAEVTYEIKKATKDMSNVTFESATFDYDEKPHTIVITGELPEGVEVSYENNTHTDVGKYTATANFTIVPEEDRKNYNEILSKTATLEILAVTGTIEITNKDEFTKQYDGNPVVAPTYTQSRTGDVDIEYYLGNKATGNPLESAPVDSGTYTVKVILRAYQGYLETFDTATFEITKIPSTIEITNKDSLSKQYDGKEVEVQYEASRENGTVLVEYTNTETGEELESVPVDSGKYSVKVILVEETNYTGATDTATFEITKIPSTIEITNEETLNRTYDGTAVDVTYEPSREGTVTVEYTNIATGETSEEAPINAGKYNVKVILAEETNYEGATDEATFEIAKIVSTIKITNEDALNRVYDKNAVEVEYEASREGAVIEYVNTATSEKLESAPVNAGEYKVTVSLAEEQNYTDAKAEVKFTIEKATIDMSGVEFKNKEVNYDEQPHTIEITGELPEGVEVSYENNIHTEVGTYTATAKFAITLEDAENYNAIPDKTATLKILPIAGKIEITNKDAFTKQYDGNPVVAPTYEKSREGNVRIEYYNGSEMTGVAFTEAPVNAGTYTVKVILEAYLGYLETFDSATFEITKVPTTIEITNEEELSREYDGNAIEVTYNPSREGTVKVEYTNTETGETTEEAPINAGKYSVKVTLVEETNYSESSDSANFEITKVVSTISITNKEELTKQYDGNPVEVQYEASREGVVIEYVNTVTNEKLESAPIDSGKYKVTVTLPEETNYTGATDSATFEITKIPTTITVTNAEALDRVYDGTAVEVEFTASREGAVVEYVNTTTNEKLESAPIDSGKYKVTISLAEETNYTGATKEVEFEIQKATKDMSKVKFEDTKFDYDEQPHTLEITGELPEGVEVSYENNTHTEVGKYTAIAKFTIMPEEVRKNYNEISDKTAVLEILPVTGTIEITNKDAFAKQYDGNPVVAPTYEKSREGNVRIEYYEGSKMTGTAFTEAPVNAGTYTVKVILEAYLGYLETFDSATFEITKVPTTIEITNEAELNREYDGNAVEVTYNPSREGTVKVEYTDLNTQEVLESAPVNAGKYSVKVTLVEETNYAESSDSAIFTITKVPSTIKITNKDELNRIYDGNAVEVTYEASREGTINVEYTNTETQEVLESAPVNAGKYSVKVTLAEELNYAGATAEISFEIEKATHDMSKVKFEDITYPYDGTEKEIVISGELPEGVTVEYENNKGTDVGQYEAIAKFIVADPANYNAIPNMTATMYIGRAKIDMSSVSFEDATYTYDGIAKEIVIGGELPEGVEVSYENNKHTDAGEYEAKAIFTVLDLVHYEEVEPMTAILTIEKATHDMSKVKFEDATYTYNGQEQQITITGELPEGVTVEYDNNSQIIVGEYEIIARFILADARNYNEIPNMTATMIIEKATHDMSAIVFEDAEFEYDGQEKAVVISGELPEGVTVEYDNNTGVDVGEYEATARFVLADAHNYNEIEPKYAVLKITPARGTIEITNKEALSKVYDGLPIVSPEYNQSRPGNVKIEYYVGNEATGETFEEKPVNAGVYTVKAILEATNNYLETTDEATFEITKATHDMSKVKFEDVTYTYDGDEKSVVISGELPEGVNVSYENNTRTVVGTTQATAKFEVVDAVNYNAVENMTATLTIEKATYDMTNVKFEDATYPYDGTEKKIEISGELPEGVTVEYENNTHTDAGEYEAIAKFIISDSENYNEIEPMKAVLRITQIAGHIEITNKDALSKVYDGFAITEPTYEKLGEGQVIVEYYVGTETAGQSFEEAPINVGTYTVKAIVKADKNYAEAFDTATFEITKATHDMSAIVFEDAEFEYDGQPKEITISGELPEGVNVSYENNIQTDAGEYLAVAKFEVVDELNYNTIENMTATLRIIQTAGNIVITNKDALNKVYDGLPAIDPIYETIEGTVVRVEYYSGVEAIGQILPEVPVNAGVYTVKIIAEANNNYAEAFDTATFEITKATIDMIGTSFEDMIVKYDGEPKSIVITGELPETVEVVYDNNTHTDAGEYVATANFVVTEENNYNPIDPMNATLTIEKAESIITITNKEALNKVYDGNSIVALECEQSREGTIRAEFYAGAEIAGEALAEAPVNAGIYTVKVILEETNNYKEAIDETTFEIQKATHDMSNVEFKDTEFIFDETPKTLEITGELPEGVTVSYENNTHTDVGEYVAVAKFTLEDPVNYNEIEDMTAILKIIRITGEIKITNKDELSKVYDGKIIVEPTYEKGSNGNVRIEYYEGTEATGEIFGRIPVNAGVYTVKVILEATENFDEAYDTATFEIYRATYDVSQLRFEDITYEYDGTEKKIEVIGDVPTGIWVAYENNAHTDAGEYEAIVEFKMNNRNYYPIEPMKAILTITQAPGNIKITNDGSLSKIYDGAVVAEPIYEKTGEGNVKVEYFAGNLPLGTALTEIPVNVGVYTVRVTLEETSNYSSAVDEAIFEITKATYDMTGVKFEDATFEYDGTEKSVLITGELPEGVTVNYENNTGIDVGEYAAVAKFTGDELNYNSIEHMTARLIITPAPIEIDFGDYIVIEDDGVGYIILDEETTKDEFENNITPTPKTILDDGEEIDGDSNIATGMEVIIIAGDEAKTYYTILKGDVDRNGKVNDSDLLMLARYMVGCEREVAYVNEVSLIASDVYEDNEYATDKDLLALAKMLLK